MPFMEVLRSSHQAQTTIPCKECGQTLIVARTCHRVYMHCPKCDKKFPLNDYISKMDEALEKFMENVYCDRV